MFFDALRKESTTAKVRQFTVRFAIGLFLFSAVMKLAFLQFKSDALYKPDPVFSILSVKQLLLLSVSAEIGAVSVLLTPAVSATRKMTLLFLLGTVFVGYKISLYGNGYNLTCNCLGQGMFANENVRSALDMISTLACLVLLVGSGYVLKQGQNSGLQD